jgi:signal transduction histidine kinase
MKLDREVIALEDLLSRTIDSISTIAENTGIDIKTALSKCETAEDGPRLIRVIVNLLTNAIKFSPPGSTIMIKCQKKEGMAEVQVCDQGRGIPSEMQATIFEKFNQIAHLD